jgi:glycosyltransferase involved in cell wall biosynthesis
MKLPDRFRIVSLCTDHRVDRRILDAAHLLATNGWPTLVVAPPAPNEDLRDETSYPEVPIFRMHNSFVPPGILPSTAMTPVFVHGSRLFPWQQRLASVAAHFAPDVIIANDLPQLGAAVMAAAAGNSAIIYDAHELYPHQAGVAERREVLVAFERELVPQVDSLVTVNDSLADYLAFSYGCPRPRVVLNCPSVRHQAGHVRNTGILRRAVRLPSRTKLLLFQGGMVPFRSLMELVEGMRYVQSDVALVLMGGRHTLGDALEARALELGLLGSRVVFVPEVPASELLPWTIGADAGIIPYPHVDLNTLMCTPNKLFEFLVAGLPILATHGTELRRLVGDQGVGLNVDMRTPEEFGRGIDAFFAGPLDTWRTRARELATRYTFEVEGQQWLDILDQACATRAARPVRSAA